MAGNVYQLRRFEARAEILVERLSRMRLDLELCGETATAAQVSQSSREMEQALLVIRARILEIRDRRGSWQR